VVRELKNASERAIKGGVVRENENRNGRENDKKSRSQISRSIILFIRFSRCCIYRYRLSLLPRPSRSQIGTSTYMYIYEWFKFGVKSLKYTRRIVVVYSRQKFCVERWGFDITGVKCLGMDFALITPPPLWARVLLPRPRNDSASNAYITIYIYIYIAAKAMVHYRE